MDKKTDTIQDDETLLSADDILGNDDVEYVTVKAWNGNLRIMSLTAGDMIEFVQANDGPAKHTAGLRLIVKSAVNKDGVRLFDDRHIPALRKKNSKVTDSVVKAILKLNGLDKKSQDALESAKNESGETKPDASPTVLH